MEPCPHATQGKGPVPEGWEYRESEKWPGSFFYRHAETNIVPWNHKRLLWTTGQQQVCNMTP
jgi:hypothetical protein